MYIVNNNNESNNMNNQVLIDRLIAVMIKKGFTPVQLAEDIGVAADTLRGFVYGRKNPQWKTLHMLDQYLLKHEDVPFKYEEIVELVKQQMAKDPNNKS